MVAKAAARVVVGADNTLSGLQALRRAVAEARARGLPLHAVRAWVPRPRNMYPTLADQRQAEAAAATQLVAKAFADTMGGLPLDVTVQVVFVPGPPGPVLVDLAGHDDLLVLGSGRRGFWRRWFRSSVTRYCIARAPCPVLVVPPPRLTLDASPRALIRELRHDIDQLSSDGPGT